MLPLLAVLIFAIMGIAALTVDVGLAFATQARLASAAPTLALERARFLDEIAADPNPMDVDTAWNLRATNLLETLLGAAAIGDDPTAGLRLETATPAVQSGGAELSELGRGRTEAELRGRTPLLFGMAALLPAYIGPDGERRGALSLSELRASRAQGDLTPQLSSGGLRGTGFAPLGAAAVEYLPVARVGAATEGLGIPGLAPVALFQGEDPGEGEGEGEEVPLPLEIDESGEVLADDIVVGCVIDPRRTASLGPFQLQAAAPFGIPSATLAYAPVLEGAPPEPSCLADPQVRVEIIGFVAVSVSFPTNSVQRLGEAQIPRVLVNTSALPSNRVGRASLGPGLSPRLEAPSLAAPNLGEGG